MSSDALIFAESCVFCPIASTFPPALPSQFAKEKPDPFRLMPAAHVILSTPHVMAFFDIQPINRGHILLCTRQHRPKMSDLSVSEATEVGKWLPVMSRAVMRAVYDIEPNASQGDWNIVQNNGRAAAQVVDHVHFHIVPRTPGSKVPKTNRQAYPILFGRQWREELDDDETLFLVKRFREVLAEEVDQVKRKEGVDMEKDMAKEIQRLRGNL